jgi:hypothetical protein
MIRTMLHWLGVVDLGRDKQKRLLSFRLTESAHALLDPEHQRADSNGARASGSSILVQPNFEVLVLQPDSRVLWTLLRVADLVRHDRVSVYNINKESVLRAVEGGLQAPQIVDFMNTNTGKHLPQNVAQSISDWARLIKHARLHRATLIEVDDPAVLDEMLAGRKTRKYVERRLSPTVAVAALPGVGDTARDDPWQRLMKELRGAGYVPHFSSEIMADEPNHRKENGDSHRADAAANSSPGSGQAGTNNGASDSSPGGPTRRRRNSSRSSA